LISKLIAHVKRSYQVRLGFAVFCREGRGQPAARTGLLSAGAGLYLREKFRICLLDGAGVLHVPGADA